MGCRDLLAFTVQMSGDGVEVAEQLVGAIDDVDVQDRTTFRQCLEPISPMKLLVEVGVEIR